MTTSDKKRLEKVATNGHKIQTQQQRQGIGANAATATLGKFDVLTDALAAKVTDNIAIQVEKKVAQAIVNGDLTEKIEDRITTAILSFGYAYLMDKSNTELKAQNQQLKQEIATQELILKGMLMNK